MAVAFTDCDWEKQNGRGLGFDWGEGVIYVEKGMVRKRDLYGKGRGEINVREKLEIILFRR